MKYLFDKSACIFWVILYKYIQGDPWYEIWTVANKTVDAVLEIWTAPDAKLSADITPKEKERGTGGKSERLVFIRRKGNEKSWDNWF